MMHFYLFYNLSLINVTVLQHITFLTNSMYMYLCIYIFKSCFFIYNIGYEDRMTLII